MTVLGQKGRSDRRPSRFRGRDASYPAPPAQIRASAIGHSAPTSGRNGARDISRDP